MRADDPSKTQVWMAVGCTLGTEELNRRVGAVEATDRPGAKIIMARADDAARSRTLQPDAAFCDRTYLYVLRSDNLSKAGSVDIENRCRAGTSVSLCNRFQVSIYRSYASTRAETMNAVRRSLLV